MTVSCSPWALHFISGLSADVIELILSRQRDDGVRIAQDGAMAVNSATAERVLQLLGYDTVMAAGGMTAMAGAEISSEFPGAKFYFSLSCDHAAVAMDGMLYDNHHPDGIAADQYPFSDKIIRRVICMQSRDRGEGA